MCIAGDPSGDEHASHVISHIVKARPDIECFGVGGPKMQAAGFQTLMPFAPFNRMGLGEVLSGIAFFAHARKTLAEEMARRRPDMLVAVDYAGFNIGMMKTANRLGIPVLWYIAPKVWAWKKNRAQIIGKCAQYIACILPFEPRYFEGYGARPLYVGNPCVEELLQSGSIGAGRRKGARRHNDRPWRIALVPGSRPQEIRRIFPSMAEAGAILRSTYKAHVRVSTYAGLDKRLFSPCLQKYGLEGFAGPLIELLAWADAAIVTSGTATLQAALMGVPHVLVYNMSLINYIAFKCIIRFPYIGLPNIIARKEIIKECVQRNSKPGQLVAHVARFLKEPEYYETTKNELAALQAVLGEKRPSEEVSRIILEHLSRENPSTQSI